MNETSSKFPAWVILASVALGGAFYFAGQKIAVHQESHTMPTVTVSGEGKISAMPDIASLSFGVTTGRKATAKEAMTTLTTQMNAVIAAVKKSGIPDKDMNTEQFSLSPAYEWSNNRQNLVGYEAIQSLRVKVRDLDAVPNVLGAATGAGANEAGNVNFTIDDPEKSRAEARVKAITQAKQKAETLAQQLGLHLGSITSFTEDGGNTPPVPMMARAYDAGVANEAKSLDMPVGEQDVKVTVSITYELR